LALACVNGVRSEWTFAHVEGVAADARRVKRPTTTFARSAETADNVYEIATDTFVVRGGKIAYQSFCGKIVPKG